MVIKKLAVNQAKHKAETSHRTFMVSLIIILVTMAIIFAISRRGKPEVVSTNLEKIPMEISGFKATEDYFPKAVYDELNADKHVYRHYRSAEGRQIDLYIGYYGTKKGGRTPHNPYACLAGAGWGIKEARKVKLSVSYYKNGVNVNYILSQKGDKYNSILHWYQSGGTRVLDSGIKQNIQRFIGRIFYNRNDGAFIRISVFSPEKDLSEIKKIIKAFAEEILTLIPKYWPVEK